MPLTLLLGGARSGKSSLAIRRAAASGLPVVFLATGQPRDDEMADRIARHRAERPAPWTTVEEPLDVPGALMGAARDAFVILDCLTLWLSNLLEASTEDVEPLAREAAAAAAVRAGPTVAVSNEVGLGIVPDNAAARRYRDALGRMNAVWAEAADEVLLVVAGRVLPLARA